MGLFVGIGAQKSGTTWIFSRLRLHPQIVFPGGKEIHFWDLLDSAPAERWLNLLSNHPPVNDDGKPIRAGEITPSYSLLDPGVISRIAYVAPETRLFLSLRNPIERAWSDACMGLSRCKMTLAEASDQWFIDHAYSHQSRRRGDYLSIITNWRQVFPKERLLVLYFDDIIDRPQQVLQQLSRHLDIDEDFYRQLDGNILKEVVIPALGPDQAFFRSQLSSGRNLAERPDVLNVLHKIYDPAIHQLETALHRSFQNWLEYDAQKINRAHLEAYQEVNVGGAGFAMVTKLMQES